VNESLTDQERAADLCDEVKTEIADLVKDRRRTEGMKQVTLARRAGVTERTIQRLESGAKVEMETLRRVGKALGLPMELIGVQDVDRRSLEKVSSVGSVEILNRSRPLQERRDVMKSYFAEMAAFDRWANEGLLAWMESHPEDPERTRAFAHLIADSIPWLYVLRGELVPADVDPEPDWTLAECRANFGRVMDDLAAFVASLDEGDFGSVVRSTTPAGTTFEHSFTQVLTNLLGHSEHHRGQIVSLIMKETGEYVPTVYMSYLRCRA